MTNHWGGAQWVLVTWWAAGTILPMLFYAAGKTMKTGLDFWSWWLSAILDRGALTLILWWGGFW